MLSAVLPVLHSLGVQVVDERPVRGGAASTAGSASTTSGWSCPPGTASWPRCARTWRTRSRPPGAARPRWTASTSWCCAAGLTWRQVVVLRAYAKYLRQAGTVFSQEYMESTFVAYPKIAALLVALFEARFAPRRGRPGRARRAAQRRAGRRRSGPALDDVASLDQDRILRAYLTLIQATLRTCFYQRSADGRPKSYVAFKLDPQAIPDLPAPRPQVRDLRLLAAVRGRAPAVRAGRPGRAALVRPAGGLPYRGARPGQGADGEERGDRAGRRQGRLRAQAEAGRPGRGGGLLPASSSRRCSTSPTTSSAARSCRRRTWCATTATTRTWWSRPTRAPRPSPTSPTRSPTAYGFWLGDAFASGGSAGYDHKKMGITARGAWESVKRHFRELGLDTQTAGLHRGRRRRHVRRRVRQRDAAVRAHPAGGRVRPPAHLPRPGPGRGRRRTRSGGGCSTCPAPRGRTTTAELISAGGGVYPRTAKSIPITPQVRAALGLDDDVTAALAAAS